MWSDSDKQVLRSILAEQKKANTTLLEILQTLKDIKAELIQTTPTTPVAGEIVLGKPVSQ
jgi:hypothetical protein